MCALAGPLQRSGRMIRLLMTGCCVACVVLVAAQRAPVRVSVMTQAPPSCDRAPRLSVVDVARTVEPSAVSRLVSLGEGEWISEINEHRPANAFEAASLIDAFAQHGAYLDLTVSHRGGDRRVLVVVH